MVDLRKRVLLTVIKSFPRGYFYRDKEYPLSPFMVIALKKACDKQKRRVPFGPIDIKKSLYPLIERGLVSFTYYKVMGKKQFTWCVTKKGQRLLYSLGRKRPCI